MPTWENTLLSEIREVDADIKDIIHQGSTFISACYGESANEVTECHQKVFPCQFNWTEFFWDILLVYNACPSSSNMEPTIANPDIKMVPDDIFKLIRCGCATNTPSGQCSCHRSQLGCTIFFNCGGDTGCCNPHTPSTNINWLFHCMNWQY